MPYHCVFDSSNNTNWSNFQIPQIDMGYVQTVFVSKEDATAHPVNVAALPTYLQSTYLGDCVKPISFSFNQEASLSAVENDSGVHNSTYVCAPCVVTMSNLLKSFSPGAFSSEKDYGDDISNRFSTYKVHSFTVQIAQTVIRDLDIRKTERGEQDDLTKEPYPVVQWTLSTARAKQSAFTYPLFVSGVQGEPNFPMHGRLLFEKYTSGSSVTKSVFPSRVMEDQLGNLLRPSWQNHNDFAPGNPRRPWDSSNVGLGANGQIFRSNFVVTKTIRPDGQIERSDRCKLGVITKAVVGNLDPSIAGFADNYTAAGASFDPVIIMQPSINIGYIGCSGWIDAYLRIVASVTFYE